MISPSAWARTETKPPTCCRAVTKPSRYPTASKTDEDAEEIDEDDHDDDDRLDNELDKLEVDAVLADEVEYSIDDVLNEDDEPDEAEEGDEADDMVLAELASPDRLDALSLAELALDGEDDDELAEDRLLADDSETPTEEVLGLLTLSELGLERLLGEDVLNDDSEAPTDEALGEAELGLLPVLAVLAVEAEDSE